MQKKLPIGAAAVLMLLSALITFQITFLVVSNKYEKKLDDLEASPEYTLYSKLSGVDSMFRQLYIGEIDEQELVDSIIQGYIDGTGDKYAQYLNSEEFAKFLNDLGGELEGIGIVVVYNDDYKALQIAAVLPDSPALKAGLMPDDMIIAVDGVDVSILGYYAAVAAMQGTAGTNAEFTIARGDGYQELIDMSVERGYVKALSVMYHMYDDGTNSLGIIKLLEFDANTPAQFKAAVEDLQAQGATEFVFDVRNNSGGELESVISVLDYLLPEGPVIRITDSEGNETHRDSAVGELDAKMAVLVNGYTASAAELFASALRDYDKAFLVGEQTFGKGSMQTIVRLPDESALRVTYRMYSPPFSDNYNEIGLAPDYIVKQSDEAAAQNIYTIADADDTQLQGAILHLRETT